MPSFSNQERQNWNRRQLIKWGLAGLGISCAAVKLSSRLAISARAVKIPPLPENLDNSGFGYNPMSLLREFDRGTLKKEDGRTVREFNLVAGNSTVQLNRALTYVSWNYKSIRIRGALCFMPKNSITDNSEKDEKAELQRDKGI